MRQIDQRGDLLGFTETGPKDAGGLVGEVGLGRARGPNETEEGEDDVDDESVGRLFASEDVEEVEDAVLEMERFDLQVCNSGQPCSTILNRKRGHTLEIYLTCSAGLLPEHFGQLLIHFQHLFVIPHFRLGVLVPFLLRVLVNRHASDPEGVGNSLPERGVHRRHAIVLVLIVVVVAARLALLVLVLIRLVFVCHIVMRVIKMALLIFLFLHFGCSRFCG
jgi:hypothetical protein